MLNKYIFEKNYMWVLNIGKREAQKEESIKIFLTQLSFYIYAFRFSNENPSQAVLCPYQCCIRFFFFLMFLFRAYLTQLYLYPTCTHDVLDTVTLPILLYRCIMLHRKDLWRGLTWGTKKPSQSEGAMFNIPSFRQWRELFQIYPPWLRRHVVFLHF